MLINWLMTCRNKILLLVKAYDNTILITTNTIIRHGASFTNSYQINQQYICGMYT